MKKCSNYHHIHNQQIKIDKSGEKITLIMKKAVVEFISIESSVYHFSFCLLFLNPALGMSDGVLVRWCPSQMVALGNLLETTSDRSTVCGYLLQIWLVPTVLPCQLSISPGPRSGSLNDPRGLPVFSTCLQRGPLVQSGGWEPWVTSRECFPVFREDGGSVSPPPYHMSWSVPDSFQ